MVKKIGFLNVLSLLVLITLTYQNCGRPGFDGNSHTGGFNSLHNGSTELQQRLSKGGFPFDYRLNQLAYMTCPRAGERARGQIETSLFGQSTFSIRVGAFDNRIYANEFGLSVLTPGEQVQRLSGGIAIRESFVQSLQQEFRRSDYGPVKESLRKMFENFDVQPYIGLAYFERSRMEGGFGWDYLLMRPVLRPFSDSQFIDSLLAAPRYAVPGGVIREPRSFFSHFDPPERALQTSLSWGKSELDQQALQRELNLNLMVVAGFAEAGSTNITEFIDANGGINFNTSTILGKGYRLALSARPRLGPSGVSYEQSLDGRFLVDVTEYDLTRSPPRSLSQVEGQRWDCFSLIVVRRIDRVDPQDPRGRPYCWQNLNACQFGPRNGFSPQNVSIGGVRYACPPQTMQSLNDRAARLRYEVARRFLPAEYWEINTHPEAMCAVPTEMGESAGQCYASGDRDPSKFIQYNLAQVQMNGPPQPCGRNGANECPAFISICYRIQ